MVVHDHNDNHCRVTHLFRSLHFQPRGLKCCLGLGVTTVTYSEIVLLDAAGVGHGAALTARVLRRAVEVHVVGPFLESLVPDTTAPELKIKECETKMFAALNFARSIVVPWWREREGVQ